MDWIDEKLEKLKKVIYHMSLKKALSVYMIICIASVIFLYMITMHFCNRWDTYIGSKYSDTIDQIALTNIVFVQNYSAFTKLDRILAEVIDIIQTWSIIVYSVGGIVSVSYLFYQHKLKQPLSLLKEATSKVGNNDLDIDVFYDSKDEMGELCRSFELMQKQLLENNQKMWAMMEEQKRLNAAFAHDLRTPLTILRGYTDFLKQYVPEGKVDEKKLRDTLSMMAGQIQRLESYSNTMKEINSLEELPLRPEGMEVKVLEAKLGEVISLLDGKSGIAVRLKQSEESFPKLMYLDSVILMEVFENLISNATRYAKSEIEVTLSYSPDSFQLLLAVADDGAGFSIKDLSMADKPYYRGSKGDSSHHFGIGLYICKKLCETHGGWISVANRMEQGAIVTAAFLLQNKSGKFIRN